MQPNPRANPIRLHANHLVQDCTIDEAARFGSLRISLARARGGVSTHRRTRFSPSGLIASVAAFALAIASPLQAASNAAAPSATPAPLPDDLRELVRRYGNGRSANFFDVTTDGAQMLIGTRFGESRQVHLIDGPLSERVQVTFGDEPIHAARFLPQDPNIVVFLQDSFGNQNYQLYKLTRDSGRLVRLSDGKTRIDDLLLARDGRRLAWSASSDRGESSGVFVAEADTPGSPRRLTPSSGIWRPLDFSPNGRTLLVVHQRSRGDAELFAVAVDGSGMKPAPGAARSDPKAATASANSSATAANSSPSASANSAAPAASAPSPAAANLSDPGKKLWPLDGVSSMRTARYSADGHDLFLISDRFSNAQELIRIDPDHPEAPPSRLTQALDWDVDSLAVSQDKGAPAAAAITVVQDGYDRMYLLEPGTFQLMPVALPPGVVTALKFPTVRADVLCIGLESPRRPEDVYQLDVRSRRIVRWTRSEPGPLDPTQLLDPERVVFVSESENIPALIYRPHNDTGAKLPVLLALHDGADGEGGPVLSSAPGGSPGLADFSRPGFDAPAQLFANELGVAVLEPTLRGSLGLGKRFFGPNGNADAPARRTLQLQEVADALDWIAAQPDLDATRVVVMSDSGSLAQASASTFARRLRGAIPTEVAASGDRSASAMSAMLLEKKHDRDAALGASLLYLREKLLDFPLSKAETKAASAKSGPSGDLHPPEPNENVPRAH